MEQQEFEILIHPLRERLIQKAVHILNNHEDAEDVIQDVFLKLWNIRSELHSYHNIEALSMQVTKNTCINLLRAKQYRTKIDKDSIENTISRSPDKELENKDNLNHVMKIISHLPNIQKSILRMKHIEGLEVEEIASITGSSPEAIRVNLCRARKRVKEMFLKI